MFGFSALEAKTYLVLSICGSLQILINQLEQPYARSLIVCDTPVNTTEGAEHSGSNYCGDRLHVIGEGALLSGGGDSCENVGRFLITLFVSGFADSHGRKAAAVLGWVLITASVCAFFLASYIAPWAKVLFIVAQGLQGMSGIGLILEIVTRDLGATIKDEEERGAMLSRKTRLGFMLGAFFFIVVLIVQYSQITEFRPIWGCIVVLSVLILGLLVTVFPETQLEEDKKKVAHTSVVEVVTTEIGIYRGLVRENAFVRGTLFENFFNNLAVGALPLGIPWIMAVFGHEQITIMFMAAPVMIGNILCEPVVRNACTSFGYRATWKFAYWYDKLSEWLVLPILHWRVLGWPLPIVKDMCRAPNFGFATLVQQMSQRLVKAKDGSKYEAMNQLNVFLTNAIASVLYSRLFNAEAKTAYAILLPWAVSMGIKGIGSIVYHCAHGPMCEQECDKMTAEFKAKAKEEADAKAKEDSLKAKGENEEPKAEEKDDEKENLVVGDKKKD